ncbi:ribonuclease T2 [Russula ochroleuca]|uniref:Ribonuclease T2 n=1 Tax=Russula ochroleuca TaxID=152965 RepID=A0A9P5MYL6_9AGAM|nr:ribonuclease T2 [Russula ochroleuca]
MAFVRTAVFSTFPLLPPFRSYSIPNTFPKIAACTNEPLVFVCENTTTIQNTCCSHIPGGLVLQTQFWSAYTRLKYDGQLLPKNSASLSTGLAPYNGPGMRVFTFWAHEFSKHATCTSTFDIACYGPDYKPHQDVVDFFGAVVLIQNALKAHSLPFCGNNGTVLQEVWYYNHEQFGRINALDTVTEGLCSSANGIHYYERTPTSDHDVRVLR